ncbi:hypothetical protein [Bacteroides cellulosilyticus]|uniref:hypothetical protein n=1 Tax=Bacteroides cellulosilyticus TaxID=246787 RepID=UPI003563FFDD
MKDIDFEKQIEEKAKELALNYCKHDDANIQREGYQASKMGFIGGAKYAIKLLSECSGFDNNVEEQEDTTSEKAKQYIAERCDVAESFPLQREFQVCSWTTARKGAKISEDDMKAKAIIAHKLTCRNYSDGKCDILCDGCKSSSCTSACQLLSIKDCKGDCGYMQNYISIIK